MPDRIVILASEDPDDAAIMLYEEIYHTFQSEGNLISKELEAKKAAYDWALANNFRPSFDEYFQRYVENGTEGLLRAIEVKYENNFTTNGLMYNKYMVDP